MKKAFMFTAIFFLMAVGFLFAKEGGTGLMYSDYGSYTLKAPSGWILDNEAAQGTPILAVFYPTGEDYNTAEAIFYTTIIPRDGRSFSEVIQSDIDHFKKEHPQATVAREEDAKTKSGFTAVIYSFSGDKWGNCDRVAFIEMKNMAVLVTLQAKNKNANKNALPAFMELIDSFISVSDEKAVAE
jgi:hypothetical protein